MSLVRSRRAWAAAVAAIALTASPSCSKERADQIVDDFVRDFAVHLGVAKNSEGDLVVSVPDCYGYRDVVAAIVLFVDDADSTVWKVDADRVEGSSVTEIVVGNVPSGFTESVPLDQELPRDRPMSVSMLGSFRNRVGSGNPVASVSFTLDQLDDENLPAGCGTVD